MHSWLWGQQVKLTEPDERRTRPNKDVRPVHELEAKAEDQQEHGIRTRKLVLEISISTVNIVCNIWCEHRGIRPALAVSLRIRRLRLRCPSVAYHEWMEMENLANVLTRAWPSVFGGHLHSWPGVQIFDWCTLASTLVNLSGVCAWRVMNGIISFDIRRLNYTLLFGWWSPFQVPSMVFPMIQRVDETISGGS